MSILEQIFEYSFLIKIFVKNNDLLKDEDKLNLILTCKSIKNHRQKFLLHEKYFWSYFGPITESRWDFNCHTNIEYEDKSDVLRMFENNCDVPSNVARLTFPEYFNSEISENFLPKSLIYLRFKYKFNKPLKNCLPEGLQVLILSIFFDQSIEGCIPKSIIRINFGRCFNQNIKNCFHEGIKSLSFNNDLNQSFEGCLPKSLEYLRIEKYDTKMLTKKDLPKSLKRLYIPNRYKGAISEDLKPLVKFF